MEKRMFHTKLIPQNAGGLALLLRKPWYDRCRVSLRALPRGTGAAKERNQTPAPLFLTATNGANTFPVPSSTPRTKETN